MEVRVAHASAVIVQHVPVAAKAKFLAWQRGIAQIAESFPGYAGTDIYPPGDVSNDEWVVVQHFDDDEALQDWLTAPVRQQWIDKIQAELGQATCTSLHGGFGAWFTQRMHDAAPPADWKMALIVLLGLYPTVMLLTLFFPGPYTRSWNMAAAMLLGNTLSVSALQWVIMPVLNNVLAPWLRADTKRHARLLYGGLVLILFVIAASCLAFAQISG